VFARPIDDVDEVPHAAIIEDSVPEISAYTGSKKRQRDVNNFCTCSAKKKECEYHYQCGYGDSKEQVIAACGYSEGGAIVFGQD
jgi:hypothetical protein